MEKFIVAATGTSLNYMPEYVANEQGFFTELGIDIETYTPDPWTLGLDHLNNKEADVVLGGIWVPVMYKNYIRDYVSIAKAASKCPLMIVSRTPVEPFFSWDMLENKRVLVSGDDGASHYVITIGSAKEGGADVEKIRFIHDFSTSMIKDLFIGGFGDFIVLQPDIAKMFIENQIGYLCCDLARYGENIPWSVYYGLPEQLKNNRNVCDRFVLGLQKGTTYLLTHGGTACRDIIVNKWPDLDVEEGIKTIDSFIEEGMWSESVDISRSELARWQDYLILGDMLDEPIKYDDLINPS